PQDHLRERIRQVGLGEKRKAGIDSRRGQDGKERAVLVIAGIAVSAHIIVADTEPGLERGLAGLVARFDREGKRAVIQRAPLSELPGSPEQTVHLAAAEWKH